MEKRLFCYVVTLVLLLSLCSCTTQPTKTPEGSGGASGDGQVSTTKLPEDLRVDGESYTLSPILMTKIAHDFEMDCALLEFAEGETVPYKDIFRFFNFSGCYSYDYRMLSPLAYPYYNQETCQFSIPHEIVDAFMTERFNTVPDPESIDCYNKETGCYELYRHFGGLYCGIVPGGKIEIRKNVYRFVVEILPGEAYDIGLDTNYRTYVVELTATGYKILSHQHGNPYDMSI